MVGITPLPTPPSTSDPTNFNTRADALLGALPTFVTEANAYAVWLAAAAQPAAAYIAYTWVSSTSGDPGSGCVGGNNATQNSSTSLRLDDLDALGIGASSIVDTMDDSTSALKGFLRAQKVGDPSKWLLFRVNGAVVNSTGYRTLPVAIVAGSAASPFTAGDAVVVTFSPAGDKGDTGPTSDIGADFVATEVGSYPGPASRVARLLNTVNRNRYSWTFSSNQLTLPAGDYMAWATAGGSGIGNNWPVLRNVTDSSDILTGVAGSAQQVTDLQFWGAGFIPHMCFTLAGTKVVQLDHIMSITTGGASLSITPAGAALAIWKRN